MRNYLYHVVFAIRNSRYEYQKIKRKKAIGLISPTFPFLEGVEEETLLEELCKVVNELEIKLLALNFCGDHVHCVISSTEELLARTMMLWKGKTAYNFNRLSLRNSIKTNKEKDNPLWAKSYFHKILRNENELFNTLDYIKHNRTKHGLKPLSPKSTELIFNCISNNA